MKRTPKIGAAAVLAVIAAGAVTLAATGRFNGTSSASDTLDNRASTSEATVTRRTLSSQTNVDATMGYAGSYDIVNQARGTLTALPAVGSVIHRGEVLYRVDGTPVVLFYGSTPAYRALAEGTSVSAVSGPDVQELNANLVALGFATRAQIDPASDEFTDQTKTALKKLQAFLGVTEDGTLPLGSVVFLPTAARITALAETVTLGATAAPAATILQATSPSRLVTIALDASQQSEVKAGNAVTITLPDRTTIPGVVWSVGKVATSGQAASGNSPATAPTIEVDVVPTGAGVTGSLDQAPVSVAITTATVKNALAVPVNALVALSSGGYAVEAIAADGTRALVPVTLGLFDDGDGLVQVNGGLRAGQRIVVPAA